MAERQIVLGLTAQIVAAYLSRNQVRAEALPGLIQDVHRSLVAAAGVSADAACQEPAVAIRHSVFPDHIVCLEDGKQLVMLRRHLRVDHAMTPAEYREKWGLPASYPMIAPNYAEHRSDLARKSGLGHKAAVPAEEPSAEPAARKVPARRAQGSKRKRSAHSS